MAVCMHIGLPGATLGSCNIATGAGTVQGIHIRYCRPLHRADGYSYRQKGQVAASFRDSSQGAARRT